MNTQDVIDFAEGTFNCKMGYPSIYADGCHVRGTKRYVILETKYQSYGALRQSEVIAEHSLASAIITSLDRSRSKIGRKTNLYWRYIEKVSHRRDARTFEHVMRARLFIDECEDYGIYSTYDHPNTLKIVVDNVPNKALLGFRSDDVVVV